MHLLALALGHLASTALQHGLLGTRHGTRPQVTVTVDADRFAAGLGGDLRIPGREDPVLLPDAAIRRILCDADLHPVITTRPGGNRDHQHPDPRTHADGRPDDREGEGAGAGPDTGGALADSADWREVLVEGLRDAARSVLYLGRTHRVVPPRLRRALEVRDRHCAFPDCRIDPSRTHAHHILEWEHGGSTDIANTVLLCHRHHHAVHEGGWTITPTPGLHPATTGAWTFTPPPRRTRP